MVNVDEVEFRGNIFRANNLLGDSYAQSNVLHSSYEDFLKKKGMIPESGLVYIPSDPKVYADWSCRGWFSIFEIAFRTGFSFPCSNLMCNVIKSLGVMPFQLMPMVWKLISAIDSLCAKHHLEITLLDLMNCYTVRTVGKGRVSFRALRAEEALITGLDSGDDKGWACRFLFINKASLDEGYEYIPDYPADEPNEWEEVIDNASTARLTAFRNLDAEERSWPRALCRLLVPQYDFGKGEVKPVALLSGDVCVTTPESDVSIGAVVEKTIPLVTPARPRTRGKGKLNCVIDEIQSSKKRVKIEKDVSKVTKVSPASFKVVDPVVDPGIGSSNPAAVPVSQDSDTAGITRVLKALSISNSDCDFGEAPYHKGKEISESITELVNPEFLQLAYDSFAMRSVFASFQALHFSSAAARISQSAVLEREKMTNMISELTDKRKSEEIRHGETKRKLGKIEKELEVSRDSLKCLEEKLLKVSSDYEERLKENAIQYSLIARIGLMLEPIESRAAWDVKEEIEVFKSRFPESKLEDWGVSEVEDDPSVSK